MLSAHALNFPCSAKAIYKKVAMAYMQMTIVEWNTKLNHHRSVGSLPLANNALLVIYVITPFGVVLLVYPPDTRGRVAPEGGGRNNTTKGVIKCLLPLIGRCGARAS